jgi:hypothetical protein
MSILGAAAAAAAAVAAAFDALLLPTGGCDCGDCCGIVFDRFIYFKGEKKITKEELEKERDESERRK